MVEPSALLFSHELWLGDGVASMDLRKAAVDA
jgi:hypothetical protein